MKHLFIYFLLFPFIAFSKEKGPSYAFFPYVNYDTTQSWSFGTSFEKDSENRRMDTYSIDGEITQNSEVRLLAGYKTNLTQNFGIASKIEHSSFFEPFYGFGMRTNTNDLKKIKRREQQFQSLFFFQISDDFTLGPFIAFKRRIEKPDYQIDNRRFFSDENDLTVGGSLLYDTRDSILDPTDGEKFEFRLSIVPDGLNQRTGKTTFSQLKLDLREYTPVYHTVLASRLALATTIGDPIYSYKFRLGGGNLLRGYQTNRFIGDKLMAIQIEDRISLYKDYIAATASYEIGSITPNLVDKTRSCYGLGLRIAMPPDWSNMLSVNFGFGDDQQNIFMDFNENF